MLRAGAGELGVTGLRGGRTGPATLENTGPVMRATGSSRMEDPLIIAGRTFGSRLFLGTGKFPSNAALRATIESCGTEMVTVALRRVDFTAEEDILDALPPMSAGGPLLLTNTSGAIDADEAVRLARLARAAGLPDWIKVEVTPDPRYLLPDPVETLRASEQLVAEGFTVLPYCSADPVLCKHLAEAGCATVMPLGSWIGSNQGLRTRAALEIIIEQSLVPVVVDAGIGAPSQAAEAMEMGADAVLVNTAIGTAGDPVGMGRAFRGAVEAGRLAFRSGLAGARDRASASSPLTGFLG
jgi:thiazole synthase